MKSALSEPLAKLSDIFSTQRKEEDDMIAEQHSLSKRYICLVLFLLCFIMMTNLKCLSLFLCSRFQENKLRHDEEVISIAKCRSEIKNMKEETRQLHEANMHGPVFCLMAWTYYSTLQLNGFTPSFVWLSLRINAEMELEGQLAKQNMSKSYFNLTLMIYLLFWTKLQNEKYIFIPQINW